MLKAVVLFLFGGIFYDEFFARTIFKTRFVCDDGSAMCFASGPIFGNNFLVIFKSYEIKVFYLSITGGYGVHTYKGWVRYGTQVRAFGYGYGM